MVSVKSSRELELMRKSGKILAATHELIAKHAKAGASTAELDKLAYEFIRKNNAIPSFKNYHGYPASICASINEEVVHGIPGERKLNDGDIIGIDIGVCFDGYHTDAARTLCIGDVSPEARRLVEKTRESFFEGIKNAKVGNRIGDISNAIQVFVEENGYSVVRELIGHGVGANLHEDPDIPNYGPPGKGIRLLAGMTLAIEPMVNIGHAPVKCLENEWTYVTRDGSLSAHYENTVIITEAECEIITLG